LQEAVLLLALINKIGQIATQLIPQISGFLILKGDNHEQ